MAALTPNSRSRRSAPHLDFTPMVDLGFLLISFFMLTTVLSKPQVMPLVMPDTTGDPEPLKASKALTVLLGSQNKVYWYEGMELSTLDSTTFDDNGLRQVILKKMDALASQIGLQTYQDPKTAETKHGSHLNVIIKPTLQSRYCNLVDALDEMAICQVRYYCVVDPLLTETTMLAQSK
jgi:biopolymer transport protein ExbD